MAIEADKVRLYPDPFALIRDFKPGGESAGDGGTGGGAGEVRLPGQARGRHRGAGLHRGSQGAGEHRRGRRHRPARGPQLAGEPGHVRPADADPARRQRQLRRQRAGLPGRQRGAARPARARGHLPAVHAGWPRSGARPSSSTGPRSRSSWASWATCSRSSAPSASARATTRRCVSDEQKQEIEGFRSQLLDTRRELREVQLALRKDIEDLQGRARFFGIAAVPIAVALLAIVMALVKRARYRRRVDAVAHA